MTDLLVWHGDKSRDAEIAWAAGVFEGEGSIILLKQTSVRLSMQMSDRDVLERFAEVLGTGVIKDANREKTSPQWRPRFHWYVNQRDDVRDVLMAFLPWLHERRMAKAIEALERLEINPGRGSTRTHCNNGHEFTEENTYLIRDRPGWRKCRVCHRERAKRAYRLQRKTAHA